MAEVLIRHYVTAIIIFALFVVGGMTLLAKFGDSDPTFTNDSNYARFNSTFNKINEVSTSVNGLQTSITDAATDFGAFGVLNALISASWQTLKLMFSSFSIMNGAYYGLSSFFGLPSWVPAFLILAVIVVISFNIYSAIFQREL